MNQLNTRSSKVAILLCTYEGERFLSDQLASFAAQSHTNWALWASDDGSQDATCAILNRFKKNFTERPVVVQPGPGKGSTANFVALTCNAGITADYYAYADQDDIWEADKLERAVRWLNTVPDNIPALYCSRTRLVDENNIEIGLSPLFSKRPSFANALVKNIAGGNTMVFNNAARNLLRITEEDSSILIHDWWAYIVTTGCGGRVFYDTYPSLRYRQHNDNLVGMNATWGAKLKRIWMLWEGHLRDWNDKNISALRKFQDQLTPENRKRFERFAAARDMRLIPRLIKLKQSGVHRQTVLENLGLVVAAIFKKI